MEDILARIREYQNTYVISARGHFLASAQQDGRNRFLGVPSLIMSTIVGASIFGTIESNPGHKIKFDFLQIEFKDISVV